MSRPVVHFEFWSQNPDTVSKFYSEVFDWNINPIPEMNYHLVNVTGEGGIGGGIMTPQQGDWPSDMTFYIDVDDLANYHDKIVAAGGEMIVEAMEVPGVGALSLFKDPDGRVIGLWKQNPKTDADSGSG